MKAKGLGLLSGGLDSSLSALLLIRQGIFVEGIYFNNGFCIIDYKKKIGEKKILHPAIDFSERFKIKINIIDIKEEFLSILENPIYGYGSAINPCIDCRILMLKKAKEIMEEEKFDFIFTGEVLKQRPMTQMPRTLKLIEVKSGLEDLIIRPLSQKLLPLTLPEKKGLVDRELLMDFEGRGRKRQMELAKELGLLNYPSPAGGCCFLTEKSFEGRFLDLFLHKKDIKPIEFYLLRFGRHFRLSPEIKLILGRDEKENEYLIQNGKDFIVLVHSAPAPFGLLENTNDENIINLSVEILLSYCKLKEKVLVKACFPDGREVSIKKFPEKKNFENLRIN